MHVEYEYKNMCMFMYTCRTYQLGSPVVSLSISCTSENCEKALREDGVQITIVHNIQVHLSLNIVLGINVIIFHAWL